MGDFDENAANNVLLPICSNPNPQRPRNCKQQQHVRSMKMRKKVKGRRQLLSLLPVVLGTFHEP